MTLIINLTIKIAVLLGIGITACKLGVVDETARSRLSGLLVNIILPVSMMLPISMMIVGAQLCEMDLRKLFADKGIYLISGLRMFLIPAAILVLMKLLEAPYEVKATMVILSAMPSGTLNVIMAEKYHCDPDVATAVVMQNTVLMFATMPLFTALL